MRTLLDLTDSERPQRRTALIAYELKKYNVDIAALSETRLAEEGTLREEGEGYTFFWKGLNEGVPRIHGVGFAVRTSLLSSIPQTPTGQSERLMSWRIPLSNSRHATLISVYAPTLDSNEDIKDSFYGHLNEVLRTIPREDKIIILGDFNARVGSNQHLWEGVIGHHGVGSCNDNGFRLLSFCSQHDLTITNTMFRLRDMHKTTWMHPRSKTWHLLDYVIVRRKDMRDVMITRSMRGADGWTDHRLVRSVLKLRIRPPVRKQASRPRLNIRALHNKDKSEALQAELSSNLTMAHNGQHVTTEALTQRWEKVSEVLLNTAISILGTTKRKNRDWFDEQAEDIHLLLAQKNKAHHLVLTNPSASSRKNLSDLRSTVQLKIRAMQNEWWTKLAHEIQGYANSGDQQQFYNALKTAYGPQGNSLHPTRSADGTTLITEKTKILERWAEHYQDLLNRSNPTDPTFLENLPDLPIMHDLDNIPNHQEVQIAIRSLKNNKATGPDNIPTEILKHGGNAVEECLHSLITDIWKSQCCPQQWKDADIISIFKKKGDRAICGNSRGISLLATSGKVLTKILLNRIINTIAEQVLPESQCGFRKDRSTADMVFVARQLQEKSIEQHQDLYMIFVDLAKAFDTVNRPLLWKALQKFGCPPTFLAVLRAMHDGAMARVSSAGLKSDPFLVATGVKQGCVIAPLIFNLYLAAVSTIVKQQVVPADGVQLSYRLDGNLFNIRRLQAKTKITEEAVHELQYADDTAIVSSSRDGLQRTINAVADAYTKAGLAININKTEVLSMHEDLHDPPVFTINQQPLKNVQEFTYLGSVLTENCDVTNEIQRRIGLASAAFGRLSRRVFLNRDLTTSTRVSVYKAICLSILLYGSESWVPYQRHLKKLEAFHINCLQRILGLKWWHKIPHTEVRRRAQIDPLETILTQRQLRWVGHTIRMPENRLPRKVLYGELTNGRRHAGGPRKRYKDHLKKSLKKCSIEPSNIEIYASDRCKWSALCHTGTEQLTTHLNTIAEEKRQRRHAPQQADGNFPCATCGRVCRSRIGLNSHQRTHRM